MQDPKMPAKSGTWLFLCPNGYLISKIGMVLQMTDIFSEMKVLSGEGGARTRLEFTKLCVRLIQSKTPNSDFECSATIKLFPVNTMIPRGIT